MAVLMFCPGSDHFSEASALIEALSIWLCSPAEQGHGPIQQSVSGGKPSVSEIHRRMSSRRDELL